MVTGDMEQGTWTLFVDGWSCTKGRSLRKVLNFPQGDVIEQNVRCDLKATNNETKYEAFIIGLTLSVEMSIKRIKVYNDYQLIVQHILGGYQAKHSQMRYWTLLKKLRMQFIKFPIKEVLRNNNSNADALTTLGSTMEFKVRKVIPLLYISQTQEH